MGERIKDVLPKRQGLWDTGKIMFSLRRDKYDRLIIGSMGRTHGNRKGGITKHWASAQLRDYFLTWDQLNLKTSGTAKLR